MPLIALAPPVPLDPSLSGSMEKAFYRGDLLFLTNFKSDPISVGEVVVFKVRPALPCRAARLVRQRLTPHPAALPASRSAAVTFPSYIASSACTRSTLKQCRSHFHVSPPGRLHAAFFRCHLHSTNGNTKFLTKGDNNDVDDRGLYAHVSPHAASRHSPLPPSPGPTSAPPHSPTARLRH